MTEPTPPLLEASFLRKLDRLAIQARRVFSGKSQGERRSRARGISVEFADHRNYAAGDDLRFLDWNIYGRLDRLFLKLFHEEEDLNLYLLLDTSRSMDFGAPSKFDFARKLAAALGYIGLVAQDRVHVDLFSSRLGEGLSSQLGKGAAGRLFGFLSSLECRGETDLMASLDRFVRSKTRSGVVVLLSDFLDREGLESPFRLLASRSHEVFLIQVLAPEEMEPTYRGHLTLVDSEESDRVDVSVSAPLLARYRETVQGFLESTRQLARRRGFRYVLARSDASLETVVLETLRGHGIVA